MAKTQNEHKRAVREHINYLRYRVLVDDLLTERAGAHKLLGLDVKVSCIGAVFRQVVELALQLVLLLHHNVSFGVIVHVIFRHVVLFCRLMC